jgi:polyhydroxyalkanoate synthesis regulator phasin
MQKARDINSKITRIYIAQAYFYAHIGKENEEKEAYQAALDVIDYDITLSELQKEETRMYVDELMRTI